MPRPNYFLSLPLQHDPFLRNRIEAFYRTVRRLRPGGFHESILVAPNRIHLTLGVMYLEKDSLPSIEDAMALLRTCQAPLAQKLQVCHLKIKLRGLASFQNSSHVHVLYCNPTDAVVEGLLREVADIVVQKFVAANFLPRNDDHYTLHATLLNTSHRKPSRGRRISVNASALLASPAAEEFDLGEVSIPRIDLCRMGSYNASGEYVSLGHISLTGFPSNDG